MKKILGAVFEKNHKPTTTNYGSDFMGPLRKRRSNIRVTSYGQPCQYTLRNNYLAWEKREYRKLGRSKAQALMSLHALSGCDTTGRLLGKRKKSWMTAFIECTEKELEALLSLQTEYISGIYRRIGRIDLQVIQQEWVCEDTCSCSVPCLTHRMVTRQVNSHQRLQRSSKLLWELIAS